MKRPLAAAGFTFLAAQLCAVLFGTAVAVTCGVLLLVVLIVYFVLFRTNVKTLIVIILISAVACFGAYSVYSHIRITPAERLEGRSALIQGRVIEQPYSSNGRYYCIIKTERVSAAQAPDVMRIRLSSSESIEAEADDIVSANVVFNRPEDGGGISPRARLLSSGAIASAYLEPRTEADVSHGKRTLYGRIIDIRRAVKRGIRRVMRGNYADLLDAFMLGDKSGLDDNTLRMFRLCGLSHLLAVSGLHLSIITHLLERLLRRVKLPLRTRAAVMAAVTLFIMALTGFSASVTRAGVMLIFYYSARAISRESDPLNSLGASVLMVCAINPFAAADVGLLLSFSATLGLLLASDKLSRYFGDKLRNRLEKAPLRIRAAVLKLNSAVCATAAATLFSMPVTALYFGEISLISIPCNLLAAYPAFGFLTLGFTASVVGFIPFIGNFLGAVFALPSRLCGMVLIGIVSLGSSLPCASVNTNYRCLPWILAAGAVLVAAQYLLFRSSKQRAYALRWCAVLTAVSLIFCIAAERINDGLRRELYVFSVGNGVSCAAVDGMHCAVVGAGGDRYLEWLASCSLDDMKISSLDAAFLPEESGEYMTYADDMAEMFRPAELYLPDRGSASDRVRAICSRFGVRTESIAGAQWSRRNISVSTYTDGSGRTWSFMRSGEVTALIVPNGADAAGLPDDMLHPDAAIVRSSDVGNISRIGAALYILSANEAEAAQHEAVLRYRGIDNVVTTAADGSLRLTARSGGVTVTEVK